MKESNWLSQIPPELTFIRKKEWDKNIFADNESMLERNVYKTNENYKPDVSQWIQTQTNLEDDRDIDC